MFPYSYDAWIPSNECDQEPEPAPNRTKPWEVTVRYRELLIFFLPFFSDTWTLMVHPYFSSIFTSFYRSSIVWLIKD